MALRHWAMGEGPELAPNDQAKKGLFLAWNGTSTGIGGVRF